MSILATVAAASVAMQAQEVELTIYNAGFGLVKETRDLVLRQGEQEIRIEDVAQRIEADSVGIRSLSAPGSFVVLEQNYAYDLISPQAILNKAVGGEVIFNRVLPNGTKERVVGTLLSAPTTVVSRGNGQQSMTWNGMVIRTSDGRILLNPEGTIEVKSIPEGLISKPTLVWLLDAARTGRNRIELSYLTQGISWESDYVLTLDQEGTIGKMKGWVTLNNMSGADYRGAKLKLLAGDVNRAQDLRPRMMEMARAGGAVADKMESEAFAEYHLYTVPRPTTVNDKEMKQVNLLEAEGVPITKELVVDASRQYGFRQPSPGQVTQDIKPLFNLTFVNDEQSNLGIPLPAGAVKVFQPDSTGSLQMLGEARIDHTPKKEKVTLPVGSSFDVRASRKRTAFSYIREGNDNVGARETWEIELRNRKEEPATVTVYERHWGEWKITQSSDDYTRESSAVAKWEVTIPADTVKTITYTVESRWR